MEPSIYSDKVRQPLEDIRGKYSDIISQVNETFGFWINMHEDQLLTVKGRKVLNISYPSYGLVGYPNLTESSAAIFNSTVYAYNGSWQSYVPGRKSNSLQNLKPGYGYWIGFE